jgi:hypothetical protein
MNQSAELTKSSRQSRDDSLLNAASLRMIVLSGGMLAAMKNEYQQPHHEHVLNQNPGGSGPTVHPDKPFWAI